MIVKLLTEHDLEFLSLKGGCTGSPESTFVKMSNCWKLMSALIHSLVGSSLGYNMDVYITVYIRDYDKQK